MHDRQVMSTQLLEGLPPVIGAGARVLVLGSMPGTVSLARGQYYANPRNTFWRITAELFGFDGSAPYDERIAALRANGVALWDVLRLCRRAGSLDAAIDRNSMVGNDFATLLAEHPTIRRVYFNGATAEKSYRKLVGADPALMYRRLPSTSPAHAIPYPDKLHAWREIRRG
jgi:hypoxanthine-DNA glycosylase